MSALLFSNIPVNFITFFQDELDLRLLLVPPSTGSGELDKTARQTKLCSQNRGGASSFSSRS